jgi:hypothetical protein
MNGAITAHCNFSGSTAASAMTIRFPALIAQLAQSLAEVFAFTTRKALAHAGVDVIDARVE